MNNKGAFNITLESIYWIGRILLILLPVAVAAILPILIYVNRDVNVMNTEGLVLVERFESCIEDNNYELESNKLEGCFNSDGYALKAVKGSEEVFINKGKYDAWIDLCQFGEYSCFNLVTFDDKSNKIVLSLVKENV